MTNRSAVTGKVPEVVLVLNGHPNLLEFQWFRLAQEHRMLARGAVTEIGSAKAALHYERFDGCELRAQLPVGSHLEALRQIVHQAVAGDFKILKSVDELDAVGHRVVHGGEEFTAATLVTPAVKKSIAGFASLAPLHNSCNLAGIEACEALFPRVPNVAVFDTSFHHSMPPSSYLYAIPYEFYQKYHIRKYGFHGNSHHYVVEATAAFLRRPVAQLKLITCHLGRGCSVTAVDGGQVLDTSMGMTPLPGLIMATRCGDLDPAVVLYLARQGMSADEIDALLNKKSGLLGLAGIGSGDLRDIVAAANQNHEQAGLALWAYVQRAVSYIGAYYAVLGGAHAVVFTGQISETNPYLRSRIVSQLGVLGCHLNETANYAVRRATEISDDRSTLRALVIPTHEELMIARELLGLWTASA